MEKIHQDILDAKHNLIICVPDPIQLDKETWFALKKIEHRVRVLLLQKRQMVSY